jgi:hypothetical protein
LADLGRADLPWIIHWNYLQKYDIDPHDPAISTSTNPIINLLCDKPYEHRVSMLPFDAPQPLRDYDNYFGGNGIYRIEWMQHHFPYYNIQCSDIIQSSRVDSDLAAYDRAMIPENADQGAYLLLRRWQLSNTSYLFGPAGFLDVLNQQLDPQQHRFQIAQRFDIVPKPGVDPNQISELEQMTAVLAKDGDLALYKFTGALPRAKLYSHWQVSTNARETLTTLAAPNFDPGKTVLVPAQMPDPSASISSDKDAGTVDFKSYAPRDIVLAAQASAPSVLLLNDKYDPNWRVLVDGKRADLFRANFIMRGVFLSAGAHTVEFKFSLPHKPLYVTTVAIGIGIALCGLLIFSARQQPKTAPANRPSLIAAN